MASDPRQLAYDTVEEMIAVGALKHRPEDWRTEDIRMHVLKAQRHLATFLLILDGHAPPDGENHLKNGIARSSMALANHLDSKPCS